MASDQPQPTGDTQSGRRVKYGTNVAVAVVAAVLIVIVINAIGYKRLFRVRLDLTASHRWSLSKQTRKVVKDLDGEYQMVMLLSEANEYHQRARDLIAEYGYLSGQLVVQEINPSNEGRMLKFYGNLLKGYEDRLAPLKDAVEQSRASAQTMRREVQEQLDLVRKVLDNPSLSDAGQKQFIQSVAQAFGRIESQYESLNEDLTKSLESALPDYTGAINKLKATLTNYDKDVFAVVIERFEAATEQTSTAAAVKEQLLQLVQRLKKTRQAIGTTIAQLEAVEPDEEYDKLRRQIGPETVVLIGPKGKAPRVVSLDEMFKRPDSQQMRQAAEQGDRLELTFLGEEKITGALVAMSLKEAPLVVFVAAGQQPALGPRGSYENVAQRLRNMNFEVREWSLVPRPSPYGQPMPPGPPPEPKPGQKAVWIVPPLPGFNPMQRAPGGDAGQKVVAQIEQRLAAGDAVMVMATRSPMAGFGMPDPLGDLVKGWSVTPQLDRVILRQVVGPDRRTGAVAQMDVTRWPDGPDDLPITRAISGMPGVFVGSSPLVIGSGSAAEGTQVWPLVRVAGKGLWAETDTNEPNPKLKAETAQDSFTIAAAIEKGVNRMVVVCDAIWATDQVTSYGRLGPDTAHILGAAYPANGELFVNSVFWLARLDQLIAAGARTQDIRRIEDISKDGLTALRCVLLIAIPLAIAIAGVIVGLVRRKG